MFILFPDGLVAYKLTLRIGKKTWLDVGEVSYLSKSFNNKTIIIICVVAFFVFGVVIYLIWCMYKSNAANK